MKKTKLFGYAMTGVLSIGIIGGGVHAFAATTSSPTPVYEKHMLDEATKQEVQAIMEKLKTNLASLGVTFPEKGDKFSRLLANLDEDTKAKAQELIEEAKEKLAELGVDHLPHRGF